GDGGEAGVAQARDGVAQGQRGKLGDVDDLRRGETMQVHLGETRAEGTQQILVPFDFQVGVQAALEQDSRAAERQHLVNLPANLFEGQDVALLRSHGAIEGAEGAILGAEVRVIDVAVDLVGGDARVVFQAADLLGGHAEAEEVVGFEPFESLLLGDRHRDSVTVVDARSAECAQTKVCATWPKTKGAQAESPRYRRPHIRAGAPAGSDPIGRPFRNRGRGPRDFRRPGCSQYFRSGNARDAPGAGPEWRRRWRQSREDAPGRIPSRPGNRLRLLASPPRAARPTSPARRGVRSRRATP